MRSYLVALTALPVLAGLSLVLVALSDALRPPPKAPPAPARPGVHIDDLIRGLGGEGL